MTDRAICAENEKFVCITVLALARKTPGLRFHDGVRQSPRHGASSGC